VDPETRGRPVRVEITVVVPQRWVWLLAGLALGNLRPLDALLDKAVPILRALRALLPG
jgi:hypothetical protein